VLILGGVALGTSTARPGARSRARVPATETP
jgi:hypothetical protein